MTVAANIPESGPHVGNGVNRLWQFDFRVSDVSDMRLVVRDASGVGIVLTSGFAIAPQYLDNDAGGYVEYPIDPTPALSASYTVSPYRLAPYEQPDRIGNQGGFYPEVHERAFDRLSMQIQQIAGQLDRTVVLPVGGDPATLEALSQAIEQLQTDMSATLAVLTVGDQSIAGVKTFSSAPVVPDGSFAVSKLGNMAGVSVAGRSANSTGAVAAITAAANDRLLGRVGNALAFVQLTVGMVADNILTYVKLAPGAIATSAEWLANTVGKLLTPAAVWGAMTEVALTDAAPVALDFNTGIDFRLTLIANSRTFGNPTNVKVGQRGRITVVQPASGGTYNYVMTKSANMKTAGGVALTTATGAGAETIYYYDCVSATKILISQSAQAWS